MSSPLRLLLPSVLLTLLCSPAPAQSDASGPFTLEQVMNAPFNSDLTAAPASDAFAWVADVEGKRNIWVAVRGGDGYSSREITSYESDDGQEIHGLAWSPDAKYLLYVRGGSSDNPEHMAPNPAHLPHGAEEDVWLIAVDGGAPRKVGEGRSPTFSPSGDLVTWFSLGQIWYESPADVGTKPPQSIQVYGSCSSFVWSPDGTQLAFVSGRGTHSFIGVFSPKADTLSYVDPGTSHDISPVWSPDGRQIAFVRVPYFKDEDFDGPQRTGEPWSIRVADVATEQGHTLWKADPGQGSVFRALDADSQLYWTADQHLIFPWEKDGWLHFYAVPAQGGAARLLTPGDFEAENAAFSPDRRTVVFSSNQGDSERRHIWEVSATSSEPTALTHGEGIETQPVFGSDDRTVAVLRSDARVPIRPAVIADSGQLRDLAPQAIPATFPATQMAVPRPVIYSATDGMKIHGDLFLPPGDAPCERHPAVVFVHGGSQRQMLLGWHYMGYYSNAYALNEYLASRGYVVLSINYRSGIGYGLDFREALQYGSTGASEFRDVEGAGLYLRSRCDVEPKHIGIWGGSWGGFLTALALARGSDLFAAGADMSGVHDWNIDHPDNFDISDTATDQDARWKLAWESSPLASVKDWRSPVLLVQGDNDDEVPFLQTLQLASALRRQSVDVQQLIFPDEVHDFLLFRDWMAAYSATAEFFEKHLRTGQSPPTQ
ncbi:MAG TPA: prolyl oligopeptidase family serine peptidase [Acidobacteriaceae bacterium]|nr:prolyl oligopeptidase family serine peptidase [Acidobacteriaceae bacterium]